MAQKKVTISLNEELLKEIDEYAESLHIGRSPAIAVLASQAVEARKNMGTLQQFIQMAEKQVKIPGVGTVGLDGEKTE